MYWVARSVWHCTNFNAINDFEFAFDFAKLNHKGQFRGNGEDFFTRLLVNLASFIVALIEIW